MHLVRKLFDPLLVTTLPALNRVINPTSEPVQHVQDVLRNTFPRTRFELKLKAPCTLPRVSIILQLKGFHDDARHPWPVFIHSHRTSPLPLSSASYLLGKSNWLRVSLHFLHGTPAAFHFPFFFVSMPVDAVLLWLERSRLRVVLRRMLPRVIVSSTAAAAAAWLGTAMTGSPCFSSNYISPGAGF